MRKKTVVIYWEEPVIVAKPLSREPSKEAMKRMKKHGWKFVSTMPKQANPNQKPRSIFDWIQKIFGGKPRRVIIEKTTSSTPIMWQYRKDTHIRKKRVKVNPNVNVEDFVMNWSKQTGRKVVWYDILGE